MALESCQMVFRDGVQMVRWCLDSSDGVQMVFRCLGIRLFGCRGRLR